MQDAVTLFSTSKLERDNEILRSQLVSIEDLRAEFDAKLKALKRGYETLDIAGSAFEQEKRLEVNTGFSAEREKLNQRFP